MIKMKVNEVYGVSNQMIATYIERKRVDGLFLDGLSRNKHIIIYGASKQGKTSLVNKHLHEEDYVKVNCSTDTNVIDIYKSIIRQLGIDMLSSYDDMNSTEGSVSGGFKMKFKIPLMAECDGSGEVKGGKSKGHVENYKTVEYNLALAQDISELLRELN